MRYAASTHFRVLAKLYKIKNDGTKSISYAKKKISKEEVKNIEYPAVKMIRQYNKKAASSFTLYAKQNKIESTVIDIKIYKKGK
jgi:hypothetical protein